MDMAPVRMAFDGGDRLKRFVTIQRTKRGPSGPIARISVFVANRIKC